MSTSTQTRLRGAFQRYRVMAFTTGVLLLLLVFVAMPMKYLGHNDGPVKVLGPGHGFLFMIYLVATLDLGIRLDWAWSKLGLRMLAGTVPFATFVVERRVHEEVSALSDNGV